MARWPLIRHYGLSLLIIVVSSIFLFVTFRSVAIASTLQKRLGIPSLDAAWQLRGVVGGYQIDVKFPQDAAVINKMPNQLQAELRQRIQYRDGNLPRMHQVTADLDDLLSKKSLRQTLEYRRELKEIVIALHPSDGELSDPLYRHLPILEKLPSYTQIHLYVPKELEARVTASLNKAGFKARANIVAVDVWLTQESGIPLKHATTRWAQDLFEVALDAQGKQYVLAPVTRYQINDITRPDNDYLTTLQNKDTSLIKLPVYFRGGNILIGQAGKRILIIGQRELDNNRSDFYTAVFNPPNNDVVLEIYKRITGAEKVYVVPNSKHLFHLDMAMAFLDSKKAAVLDPLDREQLLLEDKQVLNALFEILSKEGFEVIRIPTTTQRIAGFQSSTNIIPYTDKSTGHKKALVPLHPDIKVVHSGKPQSLNSLIASSYRKAGFEAVMVEDRFYTVSGNLHCAVNVIN